jgi:hypothetical protein
MQKDSSLGLGQIINNITIKTNINVLEELQEEIIWQHHNNLVHRHPSITRTIELIQRNYEFLGIKDKVTAYIKKCADCQRNKHSTYALYREMQPIELLTQP